MEWVILKKLPMIFILSTLAIALPMLYIYFSNHSLSPDQLKQIYFGLGLIFSVWFFVGAAAIGCIVVMIMKGPAYVADPYYLPKENKNLEKFPN